MLGMAYPDATMLINVNSYIWPMMAAYHPWLDISMGVIKVTTPELEVILGGMS